MRRETNQVYSVEYLHFAHLTAARIGQIGLFVVDRQCAQTFGIRGYVANSVDHAHVAYIVDVNAFFQAHD